MRTNNTKRFLSFIAMFALLLTTVFTVPVVASANETAANFTALPDDSTPRILNIWKYQIDSMSNAGDRGDGTDQTVPQDPLPGVVFEIIRVIPVDGAALVCPIRNFDAWEEDTTFTPQTIATDANGLAQLVLGTPSAPAIAGAGTSDGIYLVREIGTNNEFPEGLTITRTVADFFVHVPMTTRTGDDALTSFIYDIHVHPKNVLVDPLDPVKHILETVDGDANYYNSFLAGQIFHWALTSNLPSDLVYVPAEDGYLTRATAVFPYYETIPVTAGTPIVAPLFEIIDVLDPNLTFEGYMIEVYAPTGWVELPAATYTFTEDDNELVFSITSAGMIFLDAGNFTSIRVILDVSVDEDFNGVIVNTFDVRYLGPNWAPGEYCPETNRRRPPFNRETSNESFYFTGGYNLVKVSAATTLTLEGAVFHIATSSANANNGIFLTTTGAELPYGTATYPDSDVAVVFITATSDEEGLASFNGLHIHEVLNVQTPPNAAFIATLSRDFYIVETTAPTGYELLRAPVRITVTTETHTANPTVILNDPATDLPFTGGAGTIMLVAIALSVISIGTFALVLEKKRRQQEEV